MRNPGDGDQGFRRMPITDSEAWRSRIPMDADQGFRGMAITQRPTPYPESLLTTLDNLSQVGHDPLHLIEEAVMSQARLSMRKIEEILRLKWEAKRSHREIATSCGISSSTVSDYLNRAQVAGLSWPLPENLTAAQLEQQLFPEPSKASGRTIPQPDWATLHRELKRKGVTLSLLWVEYRQDHPEGYGYSQFCQNYRVFFLK